MILTGETQWWNDTDRGNSGGMILTGETQWWNDTDRGNTVVE